MRQNTQSKKATTAKNHFIFAKRN